MAELKSVSKILLIKLGIGALETGLPNITAQLITEKNGIEHCYNGSLPETLELKTLYEKWQRYYQILHHRLAWERGSRLIIPPSEDEGNVSDEDFQLLCHSLETALNNWLISPSFLRIGERFRTILQPSDHIQVFIETENDLLRRLPWHLWNFFEDYPKAEITLSPCRWQPLAIPATPYGTVRVLAVFGNSEGINLDADRTQLESLLQLPEADVVFLDQPNLLSLTQQLHDSKGWDILFFAGHSVSEGNTGRLYINPQDSLNIVELRLALKTAIRNGLHIAIFNSCDGLGLAQELERLNLPQIIVMREPVSDVVAHTFSKYFLNAFASGQSFYSAVRHAREQLQGLEDNYPCASWLPVICQHPQAHGGSWEKIRKNPLSSKPNWGIQFLSILFGIGHVPKRWWNRPLISNKSVTERLISLYQRLASEPVPSNVIRSYRELIEKAEKFNQSAKSMERLRLGNPEFKQYIKLRQAIDHGKYQNLNRYIDPLIAGLEARQSYLSLGRTAFQYQGRYHLEYYAYVNSLILQQVKKKDFLRKIKTKYEELRPKFKTDIGRQRHNFYWVTLKGIARHDLQYSLLYSFKSNKNIHYDILKDISSLIFRISPREILRPNRLKKYIIDNNDIFTKLSRLINLPSDWDDIEIYNIIFQYAIFNLKYKKNAMKYQAFLNELRKMEPVYEQINQYRKEYTRLGYRLNLVLVKPVPGRHIYNRYKVYIGKTKSKKVDQTIFVH